jgi:hypothetical protein
VNEQQHPENHPDHAELHVEVVPTGSVTPTPFTFERTMLVARAAAEAAERLKYRAKVPGFQTENDHQLPENETLERAGVRDGEVLVLIDTAGGV